MLGEEHKLESLGFVRLPIVDLPGIDRRWC